MAEDRIALLISQWQTVRPDLDARSMRISGRLLRLAKLVERRTEAVLRASGLDLWQFDVLATLRRHSGDLSPGELLQATMLTSGAMTHRLDRLERAGLIERRPNPNDRRGVLVALTEAGRELVDVAVAVRFDEAARIESVLSESEATTLATFLATLEHGISELPDP